ncbi:unnamed protein product [Ilex paraguariensis]|uniref:Homeobox domain-containing protein n=1 Tax=Ilex paraguariensis TaxID=185542 RepID=A0ABC8TMP2_9AQUA
MSQAASSRWCPTPEQVMILEEMYRGGIKTPNASQIQQITAHLSCYGRIEGKNVFYWFQNHKARDRQKLRKKLSKPLHQQKLYGQHQYNWQSHHHSHLLHYLHDCPAAASSASHQLPFYNLTDVLHQGGVEDASRQMMNYKWKMDLQESCETENSMLRTYGCDWRRMVMMDVCPTTHCCSKPLKTLELFPITATSLKDQCNTSKNISSSTPTNI